MRPCIIIPYYNHPTTVAEIARAAQAFAPVLIVDDGSTQPVPIANIAGCITIRLDQNKGKGAALRAGFRHAYDQGFTHAITMDADGQHSTDDLPKFLAQLKAKPEAFLVGVRDFYAAGAPAGRRRSNAVSSFWYKVETGIRLGDTQCGFRCYPLALTQKLRIRSERYAFELEFLVRAAWLQTTIVAIPVSCEYRPEQLRSSHFRPYVDLARITTMNIGLVLQSWMVPSTLRAAWSAGEHKKFGVVIREFLSENAHQPVQLSAAVGLGLFCGIAPIWGYQMVVTAALAHLLRLNKAIALLASNISIPPIAPFILYGALALGHRLFTGHNIEFSTSQLNRAKALEYLWQWCVGSLVLGAIVAAAGAAATYCLARLLHNPSSECNQ